MPIDTFDTHTGHPMLSVDDDAQPRSAVDVMTEAGALFEVEYATAAFINSRGKIVIPRVEGGQHKGKARHKYVVRVDTQESLGLHSHAYPETETGYGLIAEMADALFPERATSCTVFGSGEKIALTQNLVEPVDLGGGDVIQPSIMWVTSFNGTWATAVHDLTGRLFCSNQMFGHIPLFKVRHTRNHDTLVEVRAQIVSAAAARAETMKRMALTLRSEPYAHAEFQRLVQTLVPKDEEDQSTLAYNNASDKHDWMWTQWFKEKKEWGDGNRWLAYNAVQGAEQHHMNGQVRGRRRPDRALQKAIDGKTPLADKALALLTA